MDYLIQLGMNAENVKYELEKLLDIEKNNALLKIATLLRQKKDEIILANQIDIDFAKKNGMHPGLIDRLKLDENRINAMAKGLEEITLLEDPIGLVLEEFYRPNGIKITKKAVPLGVIGIIYESRPNVTVDAFGLCFKSGNVVILKGGSDAINSNMAIADILRQGLTESNINPNAIQLITKTDRNVTMEFMKLKKYIDILIPRGGSGLIKAVVENSSIPVIETGTGNCHIYIDNDADLNMAIQIIVNAKTQRIGVCNACESLVVHKDIAEVFLPMLENALSEYQVELRADERAASYLANYTPTTEEDFYTEYLDFILSIKTVNSVEEAIAHINRYNTKHSESIITNNDENKTKFLNEVDAACVYANASTRFTDGFEFGFGAEIGISTQKLHARGPMGLKELTSYKYIIEGEGQIR